MTPEQVAPIEALQKNIERVFYGKPEVVKSLLVAVLSGGHVLIEDVPGVGKTLLAKALARSLDCAFQRIQFTSDLLPSDVTGVSVYDPGAKQFVFKPGPIFANVLLADEINRTSPRTQSALLEGMNDFQISADGVTHPLPEAVHRPGHAEPVRVRGDVSAAGIGAGPLLHPPLHRLSAARGRDAHPPGPRDDGIGGPAWRR